MDVIGVLLGDVDEDADDVDAVDHVDRRGGAAGREVGPAAVGRGVARGGQDEIEGIGVAGHDDAVKRRGQHEVVHPGLEPFLLALGHFQVGFGDPDVDLGLG